MTGFLVFLVLSAVMLGAAFYLALVPKKDSQCARYLRFWVWGIIFIVGLFPFGSGILLPIVFLFVVFFSIFTFVSGFDKLFVTSLAKWLGCFGLHKFYLVRNADELSDSVGALVWFLLASVLWLSFWYSIILRHGGIGFLCGIGLIVLIVRGIADSVKLDAMTEEEFVEYRKKP